MWEDLSAHPWTSVNRRVNHSVVSNPHYHFVKLVVSVKLCEEDSVI